MGSPLSPILADIVMENILVRAIKKANIPPQYIKKYVDDLFAIVHRDKIQETLEIFNEQNENITFTCEIEKDGKLPYLDLLVVRGDDGRIATDWYAKPMASGRLLNFFSYHQMDQKLAVASNFIDRVRSLSTIKSEREQNVTIISILRRNDYPPPLINRLLRQPRQVRQLEKPTLYRSIINVPGLTTQIKHVLRSNLPSVGISCKNEHPVSCLYKTAKDPIPPLEKSNVIYKLNCTGCHCCYVGMTTNTLKTRMYGHNTHLNKLRRLLDSGVQYTDSSIQQLKEKTALMEHCVNHQHWFDVNNPKIVDGSYKAQSLPILEMCQIRANAHTVNRRTDTDGLNIVYTFLLSSIQQMQTRKSLRSPSHTTHDPTDVNTTTNSTPTRYD